MENARKGSKWVVLLVLCIAALLSIGVYIYFSERSRIIPPRGIVTLDSFARDMPKAKRLVVMDVGGANRFVWIGEKSKWFISSGPPCYVFDSSGRMIDWDWETGSGQTTTALAAAAAEAEPLTVDQAMAIVREVYRPNDSE